MEQINELENEDPTEELKEELLMNPIINNLVDDEGENVNDSDPYFEDWRWKQRQKDEDAKEIIKNEIAEVSEDILQLEQAIIELDEQNTMNAIEISKREAKVLILKKQLEENQDKENFTEEAKEDPLKNHIEQHNTQIEILTEATKANLEKRQTMRIQQLENYNRITKIRSGIHNRIESDDVKEYLLLLIKCQFLEFQNVQLLLNLQLQAKTISKYDKYFSNLENIPITSVDDDDDDLLEEEEEEGSADENYEEEKFESSTESKIGKPKASIPGNSTKDSNSKVTPMVTKKPQTGYKKFTLLKNPYLVQQNKKTSKKK